MKKFFNSFYVFTKFSLNFILLISVFFLIYIIYINYRNEDVIVENQYELENKLRANINENSEYIKNISKEIVETKTTLLNIEKIIKENSDRKADIDLAAINKSIDILNKNFKNLNSKIVSIENQNLQNLSKSNPELINHSINEIVELIKIKYENNLSFDKELKYIEKIKADNNNAVLEKISILKNNKYKGHIFLGKSI